MSRPVEREGPVSQPVVDEQVRRKAEAITMVMGSDYDMTVGIGEWGSGNHWNFIKNHVNLDPKDLAEEDENVSMGVAAHEGCHKLVSRAEHVKDLWQEDGFAFGFNACEDPRANEGGMHQKPGIRPWIKAYIERDLERGGGLNYLKMETDTEGMLGYVPKHMKWGAEMIRYWHEKEFNGGLTTEEERKRFLEQIPDEEVRATVEKALPGFEEYYHTIPDTKDEMDVQRNARQSAQIFKDRMWPDYRGLVEKSMTDQSLVKMLKDMLEGESGQDGQSGSGQGKGQGSGNGGGQMMTIPFGALPKEIQDEIRRKIQEQREKNAQNNPGQGQSDGTPSITDIPWDKLSGDAKEAVGDIFDQLPDDVKEEYRKRGKKDIEGAEDVANEKLRGKMTDPRTTKTHKEQREEDEESERDLEQQAEMEKEAREMEEKRKKAVEKLQESPYFHYLRQPEVDRIRREQEREFKKLFEPTDDPDLRFTSSGLRPSMGKIIQREADNRIINIFESKGQLKEKKYRFLILIDLSSSMAGQKIEETFKALLPIVENLNRFGIEFAVVGFGDGFPNSIFTYKDFDVRKLRVKDREKIGELLGDTHGSTPTWEGTQASYKALKKRMQRKPVDHNFLITITDGQPNSPAPLLQFLKIKRKDKSVVGVGLGVGPQTEFVNQIYAKLPDVVKRDIARKLGKNMEQIGNSFSDAVEFSKVFAIIIGYMIKRPELFFK
jgi:Mg-chelatase subunit ChlD